jgi:hypothetical protein
MKLLILAHLMSTTSVFAQSHINRYTKLAQQAGPMTDLHFCVLMADGVELSYGGNALAWKGLDCNDVTDMKIEEQIINDIQIS